MSKRKLTIIAAIILILIGTGIFIFVETELHEDAHNWRNAVVANGDECARVGMNIIRQNGSAADAAIATLFCEGITCTQSMGLGGGFVMTIYNRADRRVETLTARERAPLASKADMFSNITGPAQGIMSVAVPGELKGYWELHQKYGKLPWRMLIEPTISLCKNGHVVTEYLGWVLEQYEDTIASSPSLREIFINPATNKTWLVGDKIKRPVLANTLEIIADEGADSLYTYNGTIAKLLIGDIAANGGIITIEDLVSYETDWDQPIKANLRDGNTLYSVPLPSSGGLLAFILNVMKEYKPENTVTYLHRIIESFKFAYGLRSGLGDSEFVPDSKNLYNNITNPEFAKMIRAKIVDNRTYQEYEHYGGEYANINDHGTAQISVLTANGDAISVTSTINTILGSKIRSRSTGIILNDEMDDFSTPGLVNTFGIPASPANFIEPRKRPLSSMCPTIILDENGDVLLLIGGAGGSKITTSTAYSIIRHLYLKEPLSSVINAKRLHHQLVPMRIDYEEGFDNQTLQALEKIGHLTHRLPPQKGFSAVTAISRASGVLEAVPDARRHGSAEVY